MALHIYYDKDADLGRLEGTHASRSIGYGSQGHAHAQNLRSSGVDVVVGLRKDSPLLGQGGGAPGCACSSPSEAAREARIVHADAARRVDGRDLPRAHRAESRSPATTSPSRTASTSTSA